MRIGEYYPDLGVDLPPPPPVDTPWDPANAEVTGIRVLDWFYLDDETGTGEKKLNWWLIGALGVTVLALMKQAGKRG